MNVTMGATDEDTLLSLAGRLSRVMHQLSPAEKEKIPELAGGKSLPVIIKDLLHTYDPDVMEQQAAANFELSPHSPPDSEQVQAAQKELIDKAVQPFYGPDFREYIENVRKKHEQIIDAVNRDSIAFAGWDKEAEGKAKALVEDFRAYIEANKDEITALRIFYQQSYQERGFTYRMIKELADKLQSDKPQLAPLRVWQAYEQLEKVNGNSPKNELMALVALVRRVVDIDETLTAYDKTVDKNFQEWVFRKQAGAVKFTAEQMDWLRMIKEHIAVSFRLEWEDLDYTPFDAAGGIGKMYQLFEGKMDEVIEEMNTELVA